jgi:type I restriction enzyme M protein
MDYWAARMQDDVYLIAHAGWADAAKPRLIVETKEQKSKEEPDFTVGKQKYKSDLIPAPLIVAKYFGAEKAAIEAIESELDSLEQTLDELREEHGVEGGLLEEVVDEKGKISRRAVAARLREVDRDPEAAEEKRLLCDYLKVLDKETDAKARLKAAQAAMEECVAGRYGKLTADEIKTLVVEDNWLATLAIDARTELDRVSQTLTERVAQLARRYAVPLPKVAVDVAELSAKVRQHLKRMGAKWD